MLYPYKWRAVYKDRNEMCSFINEQISNCIYRNVEHLDINFCAINYYVNILGPG
jgi:hypothetical protein